METINSALVSLEESIANKKISIDDGGESFKTIIKLKSSKILEDLSRKYSEKSEQIKILKEKIENHEYVKRKKELQDNASSFLRKIEENKKLLEHQEKSDKDIETEIENLRNELKNKLREI